MYRWSEEEYLEYLRRTGGKAIRKIQRPSPPPDEAPKPKKPSKHRNVKQYRYEDGTISEKPGLGRHGNLVQVYDSEKECRRHMELLLLEKAGVINGLECQKVLLIAPAFTDRNGKKHRPITYRADFSYFRNGTEHVIEDVKGFDEQRQKFLTTEAFNIKWKLLQSKYRDLVFELF